MKDCVGRGEAIGADGWSARQSKSWSEKRRTGGGWGRGGGRRKQPRGRLTASTAGLDLAAGKVDLRGCAGLFHAGLRLHAAFDFGCHGDERLRSRVRRTALAKRLRCQRDAPTCSTFVEFFADVSKKGISRESANSCTQCVTRAQNSKPPKSNTSEPWQWCSRQLFWWSNHTCCLQASC
jgi:hypothetical protein